MGTAIIDRTSVINSKGCSIDIATVDQNAFYSSAIGTYIDQKIKDIKTRSW